MSEDEKVTKKTIEKSLNKNQERFCWLYANPPPVGAKTAQEAYARAYPHVANSSTAAFKLLKSNAIQNRIAELRHDNAKRIDVEPEQVIAELAKIAFAKITDYIRWDADGNVEVIPSDELTDDQAAAIREFYGRINRHSRRVRLHDKIDALDRLAKYLGLFTDKVDITSDGRPIGSLTNDERFERIVAIVESARSRRTLSAGDELEE